MAERKKQMPILVTNETNPISSPCSQTPNPSPAMQPNGRHSSPFFLVVVEVWRRSYDVKREMASPQCCSNPPTLNPKSGGGTVVDDFGGLKAYTSSAPSPNQNQAAILLVCDIFGFEAPNLRKIADKAAAAGFFVVVPDFMHGDPYDPSNAERPRPIWLKSHTTDKGYEEAKKVISELKNQSISTIGSAGFCWGAKVVTELAKSCDIQSAVLLHPSFVTVDDIKEVKCSLSVLGAENDHTSPPALVKQFEEVLSAKSEIASFAKIFPGVEHGWSVRYKDDDEAAVKKAEEAADDMLDWFLKTLK